MPSQPLAIELDNLQTLYKKNKLDIIVAGGHSETQKGRGGRHKSRFVLAATDEASTHLTISS